MREPRISLVVPAWNEADYLPELFASVAVARERAVGGPDAVEVIVADNGSTDSTVLIAREAGCRVVPVEPRIIAAVRNGGAEVARGAILAFIDADSRVHPDTFRAIEQAMGSGRIIAGSSGVTFDRWTVGRAVTYAVVVPIAWLTRVDTGVVFFRRDDFIAVGGYDERLPFAEDVDLMWRIRAIGKRRGQALVRLRGAKATTSTRKFEIHGDWHWFRLMAKAGLEWLFSRQTPTAMAYWYGEGSRPPRAGPPTTG